MGCDIHLVLEKKHEDVWIGINDFPYLSPMVRSYDSETKSGHYWIARTRNYRFFGELADVRCNSSQGLTPVGIPPDASDLTNLRVSEWGDDGHSHSWMPARGFITCWLIANDKMAEAVAERLSGEADEFSKAAGMLLGLGDLYDNDSIDNYRVVFWFDN